MATKDLSRTVVEPARSPHLKGWRHESIRSERVRLRRYLKEVVRDLDHDEVCEPPVRRRVTPDFGCHLRPLKRWLSSRIGQPWDAVFRELCSRFDRRTFRGYHIVREHVLVHMVDEHPGAYKPSWDRRSYYVDDDGILRYEPCQRRSIARQEKPAVSAKALERWLAGRKVGRRDSKLFWFVPVERYVWNSVYLHEFQDYLSFRERMVDRWTFRQDRPLIRDEVAFYERLPSWVQVEIAEGLADAVRPQARDQRPFRGFFYRVPAPGAPPLVPDDEAA